MAAADENEFSVLRSGKFSNVVRSGKYNVMKISFPSNEDLNRSGNIGISNTILSLVVVDYGCMNYLSDRDPETNIPFTDSFMIFLGSARFTMDESLYELVDSSKAPDLVTKQCLCEIGNSSWTVCVTLEDQRTGKVLAKSVMKSIAIERATQKPKSLPQWWRRKYGSWVTGDEKLEVSPLKLPAHGTTFTCALEVRWNDTDINHHLGFASYVSFCLEGAMNALKSGFYNGFQGDIMLYNAKELRVIYASEAMAGDVVNVVTWQDLENSNNLNFVLDREGKLLFQCSIEFYPLRTLKARY